EDRFARRSLIGGTAPGRDATVQFGVRGQPAHRVGQSLGIPRRDEERTLLVDQQLACGGRVSSDERGSARDRLERLVRYDPLGLAGGAEDSERATRTLDLCRQMFIFDPRYVLDVLRPRREQSFELSAADE